MREFEADYSPVLERFTEILQPMLGDFRAAIYPVDDHCVEIACDTADDKHYRHRVARIELDSIRDVRWCAERMACDFASYLYANHFIRRLPAI